MRELSLFSGGGGGLLASKLLGWETIGYVELENYCQRVIRARIDDGFLDRAPIFTDVRQFLESGAAVEYRGFTDVVTAGFPCQPYSTAARGRNRRATDLWCATVDVIRAVRPTWIFLENVTRAGQSARICASVVGAPHRRPRGWLVAYADGEGKSRRTVDAEMAGVPPIQNGAWWSSDVARTVGMDDGLAYRMDRLRALGNGQVAAVATRAWAELTREAGYAT